MFFYITAQKIDFHSPKIDFHEPLFYFYSPKTYFTNHFLAFTNHFFLNNVHREHIMFFSLILRLEVPVLIRDWVRIFQLLCISDTWIISRQVYILNVRRGCDIDHCPKLLERNGYWRITMASHLLSMINENFSADLLNLFWKWKIAWARTGKVVLEVLVC